MVPYGDAEFGAIVDDWFFRTEELLFGRTTYDIFTSYWPQVTDPADRVAARLNGAPSTSCRPVSPTRRGRAPP